jgi:3-oxoacid CoA-transferase subunit B
MPKLTKEQMAIRTAEELTDGQYVNLGIGLPTLVSDYINPGDEIIFHSENGILGMGGLATPENIDPDLVNAGKYYCQVIPGACFFSQADAHAMVRGGHIDVSILGAYQVSEQGDLANWLLPSRNLGSVGGAMEMVHAKRVIALMTHTSKTLEPKIVKVCTYPLTARKAIDLIVTDLAVIEVTQYGLVLQEVAPDISVEEVQAYTEPHLIISPYLKEIEIKSPLKELNSIG